MRRLILLRHAKSAWPDGVADRDRPLAKRGRQAAPEIGAYLAEQHLVPDLALVSPARRTRETWDLVKPAFDEDIPTRTEPGLYEASFERLLTLVKALAAADDPKVLILVGHNPGLQDLSRRLVGHGDRYALARMTKKFPTAALAVIDFSGDGGWGKIAPGGGRLDRFVTPQSLGIGEDE